MTPTVVGNALFEAVVEASGLASLFAPAAIARACARAGLDAKALTRSDIRRALPAFEQALRVYLPEAQVRERLAAIERLGRSALLFAPRLKPGAASPR